MSLSRRMFLGIMLAASGAAVVPLVNRKASAGVISAEPWAEKLITAAKAQIGVTLVYDPSYSRIDFPGGDVARYKGVCTDVLIRAYRDGLGVDLQNLVNADMRTAFAEYPRIWGLRKPDSNIDHRRVPNLQVFLKRRNAELPVRTEGLDYLPGDIITQRLPGNKPHILLVSDTLNNEGTRPQMIHNIGLGARMEDVMFNYPVTGHYRFPG